MIASAVRELTIHHQKYQTDWSTGAVFGKVHTNQSQLQGYHPSLPEKTTM